MNLFKQLPRLPSIPDRVAMFLPASASTSTVHSQQQHLAPQQGAPILHSATTRMSPDRPHSATFGVDLEEQMRRDGVEVPKLLDKCCTAIERYGMTTTGIYRISGANSKVVKLKAMLDQNVEAVNLDDEEWTTDVNVIASVMKQWLRELPDPVIKFSEAPGFIDAARIDNDRLRHIRLHERVNELPDANYATIKFIMGHLYRISQNEGVNSMGISNLAIVFGPTLFGFQTVPPPPANGADHKANGITVPDTQMQNRAIETILVHYNDIFVEEEEDEAQSSVAH